MENNLETNTEEFFKTQEVLAICSIPECKAIKITPGDVNPNWMKESENPELYRKYFEHYENPQNHKLSHSYCPPCFDDIMKKMDEEDNYNRGRN
ncbi:MAG: hypothetical protein Q7S33_04020 [Nanoarchaeota archaeon]|nr:hypothetical protein [Nanoarchaeota archaeon]